MLCTESFIKYSKEEGVGGGERGSMDETHPRSLPPSLASSTVAVASQSPFVLAEVPSSVDAAAVAFSAILSTAT